MEPSFLTPEEPVESSGPFVAVAERLALLSGQERAVLDLAATGRTDEQIAQALGLSVSTINSYWVRIRGKVGLLSRVEIVSGLLRHQALEKHRALRAENRRLAEEIRKLVTENEELHTAHAALRYDGWHGTALLCSPEAMLVTKAPAMVVFANRAARRLYRADARELEGMAMRDLTTAETPEGLREPCRDLFREGGPERETVGIEEPYFARRRDGTNFRAVLQAERFFVGTDPFAVVTVREYLGDMETILRALRQPLATG